MKSSYAQQMRKGILEIVVLKAIAQRPTYGYELITFLKEKSGGGVQLRDGTLYPILYRLEDDGLVQSQWQGQQGRGKPTKIYSITPKGEDSLAQLVAMWNDFSVFVNNILREEEA